MEPVVVGKAIVPLMFAGAFVLMAFGTLHLNPERTRVSSVATGIVALVGGIFFIINITMFQATSGLGIITNYVAGLAVLYGLFFMMVGLMLIFGAKPNMMAPIAIIVAWITLAYGLFFLLGLGTYAGGIRFIYHFSICLVWFIAMNCVGFFLAGKFPERIVGAILMFASIYTFAIPGFLWALGPGAQGPF